MTTPNPRLLVSPYADLGKDDVIRSSMDLSVPDHQLLKSLAPGRGITQTIVQALVHKLCYELRKRSITDYTDADLVCHVLAVLCADAHPAIGAAVDGIITSLVGTSPRVGRSSAVAANGATADRDDGRTTKAVGRDAAKQSHVVADASGNADERSNSRRTRRGGAKTSSSGSGKGTSAGFGDV